ncbi:MAG: molybdopterin biosynthesis protein [Deltaproteobacteria bacterium]|nr:molybdopterin biosynthesis protein [Deltaproteobacteria bacterium]
MERNIYLSMMDINKAGDKFFSRFPPAKQTGIETIKTGDAFERVTAKPLFAKRSAPSFHSAAMDGIAVRAEDTYGTTERYPKTIKIGRHAVWINTGQVIPGQFNAVIMVEKVNQLDDETLEIRTPAYPWQNVRKVGEDIVATELVLPQGHLISPYDVGALLSAGIFSVTVRKRPVAAIIPTGSELVHYEDIKEDEPLGDNRIIEYNSRILAGFVRECRAIPIIYDIVPDIEDRIKDTLKKAVQSDADVIIINAGSSAGSRDYTMHAINEMGEVLVHGVAMMPGKPTILGIVEGKPVIGNPGYPVSAIISFEQFVKPLLYNLQGINPPVTPHIQVYPTRNIPSRLGIEEFLRVNIGKVGSKYVATPLKRAAGSITTLTKAEGIIRIPALKEGILQDEEIKAELLVDEDELLKTVVIIGSHDINIDILADEIRTKGHDIRISSGNVGSLGGLIALKKGACHMAGSHLLDTKTGRYNISYIEKYLKGMSVSIFHLVLRDQGLITAKGNPKKIKGIEDLIRDDITFVNRQPGSGTRVLFDYKLGQTGIKPESINGYDHDEFTHMAVAVDVLSGAADCGMGIFAAAKALDLGFIPMVREQYDLVIPTEIVERPNILAVIETIRSRHFRERVMELGGYDPSRSGQFWMEIDGQD